MHRFLRVAGILVVLSLSVAACDSTSVEQHVANAQQRLAEGELRTAVIELKNALQKAPDHAQARLLLGEAQARLGDFPSALKEFERALDLGLDNDRVRLGLLSTKVRLGRIQEVIGALEQQGALEPAFAVVLADAYLGGGDTGRAEVLYQQAPSLSGASLGLGLIAWQNGDLDRAAEYLEQAVAQDPDHWQAWLRKGEFELARERYQAAESAFAEAVAHPGARVLGQVGLARVDLLQGRLDDAMSDVSELLRLAPAFAVGHYLDGLIKFERQDIDGAEAAIREAQRTAPDHPPSLYLMGAIKYRQGQLAQAENHLQRYLAYDPGNPSAAKLLAAARFDQGDFDGAVDVLAPLVDTTADPQILAMYGAAQLRLGAPGEATEALQRSVALAPDMAPFRNQLALSLLAAGERGRAEAELNSAIEVDGEQFESDYLLAMLRMRNAEWDAAAEAVDALVQKNPDSPIGYNLRGAVALARDDVAAARSAFRDALDKDRNFFPAVQNLARLEETGGDPVRAARQYEDFLAANPGHEDALLALAGLAFRAGDAGTAVRHLEAALAAHPGSVRASVGLSRLLLVSGRAEEAGRVLTQALERHPDASDLRLMQAEVHLRNGNTDAARRIAAELQAQVSSRPVAAPLHLALGQLQARLGEPALAEKNLQRVLELSDGSQPAALQGLARIDLQKGDLGSARARVDRLLADSGERDEIRLLHGDLLMAEGRRAEAEKVYAELAESGARGGVFRLATLSLSEGATGPALERLEAWLRDHPQDLGAELLVADTLLRQDADTAMTRYERLVETGNPVVLNNLAWLYMQRDDPRALEMARRAVEAAPNNADILDTLGWILLKQNGATEEAVRVLRRSVQLNPGNPSVHYHLGVALQAAGDEAGAQDALTRALESERFPEVQDARDALAALSRS